MGEFISKSSVWQIFCKMIGSFYQYYNETSLGESHLTDCNSFCPEPHLLPDLVCFAEFGSIAQISTSVLVSQSHIICGLDFLILHHVHCNLPESSSGYTLPYITLSFSTTTCPLSKESSFLETNCTQSRVLFLCQLEFKNIFLRNFIATHRHHH